jgi:hypothetical protein
VTRLNRKQLEARVKKLEIKSPNKRIIAAIREFGGPWQVEGRKMSNADFEAWAETLPPEVELWRVILSENEPSEELENG